MPLARLLLNMFNTFVCINDEILLSNNEPKKDKPSAPQHNMDFVKPNQVVTFELFKN